MANPIEPGDIVSIPDDGGGAGAAVLTSQIVNATWRNGQARTLDATNRIDFALDQVTAAPTLNAPTVDQSLDLPDLPVLNPSDSNAARQLYDDTNLAITNSITSAFATFQTTYFPDLAGAATEAMEWVRRALTTGGLGISPVAEAAAWARDRARITSETARVERETIATWADRGFPTPPGALTHQIKTIRLGAAEQLAAQSRDIAIKTVETEVENARIAVNKATELRIAALNAAGDYVKTLILGPTTAMNLATGLAGLENDFARTLTAFYAAQVQAKEPLIRLRSLDAELNMRAREANLTATIKVNDQRVSLAIEAAKMCATQAAAMLNGINAGVSIGASDSTQRALPAS